MKVVHYYRIARSPLHLHAGSYSHCFYIPEENVILYSEQQGTFGGTDYSIVDRAKILKEAKNIAKGRIPNVKGVEFEEIKEFEYDNSKLRALIRDAKTKKDLDTKVRTGIENLLKQVEE